MKKSGFYRYFYDFLVDYDSIDVAHSWYFGYS